MNDAAAASHPNRGSIYYLATRRDGDTTWAVRHDRDGPRLRVRHYDWLFKQRALPRATYIFSDLERLSGLELEFAGVIYRQLVEGGATVLNNPARVKRRFALLRGLFEAGLNDFNAYRPCEGLRPDKYPVFIRQEDGHDKPLTDLLYSWSDVDAAIERAMAQGVPSESMIIIEYAGEPVRDGLFRKIGQFRIGENVVPHLCVHEDSWLVKHGKLGIADEALYREELEIAKTLRFADAVQKGFDLAEIDYGRADFGLLRGRVQIFEINTDPTIARSKFHPSALRLESEAIFWNAYLRALGQLCKPLEPGRIRISNPKWTRCRYLELSSRIKLSPGIYKTIRKIGKRVLPLE